MDAAQLQRVLLIARVAAGYTSDPGRAVAGAAAPQPQGHREASPPSRLQLGSTPRQRRLVAAAAAGGPRDVAASGGGDGAGRPATAGDVFRRPGGGRSPSRAGPGPRTTSGAAGLEALVQLDDELGSEDGERSLLESEDLPEGHSRTSKPLSPPGEGAASPRWFANSGKTHTYEVLRIEKNGATSKQELRRRELLRTTGLPARDLRRIDPALALTTSAPTLLVSDQVLLINLGQVRVIVAADHALLFEPHSRVAASFLEGLLSRLSNLGAAHCFDSDDANCLEVATTSHGGGGSGGTTYSFPQSAPPAFELEVVEAALLEVTGQLDSLLLDCTTRVASLLRVLPQRLAITAEVLEELRLVKQALVELESRAGNIRSLLLEVLDDQEDVAGMLLALRVPGVPQPTQEVLEDAEDEVENLLEYYLQRCETCHGEAERLLENTRDLEESISVSLSARRFEVSKLELSLSIATFATAVGALVAGIFGMNLRNRFEMSALAFYGTAAGIMLGVVVVFALLFKYTRRKRIL